MGKTIKEKTDRFTTEQAEEIYGLEAWGRGYFRILPNGHLAVQPPGGLAPIDVLEVVETLKGKGIGTPHLLRFPQLLDGQLQALIEAFRRAREEFGYGEPYLPVYPVKVNQQTRVLHGILAAGRAAGLGLEVGSRPELLAAAGLDLPEGSLVICNGFKDSGYIEAASLVEELGRKVILVLEKPFEFDLALEQAAAGRPLPRLGLRIKLQAKGSGLWEKSGGFTSKFGLTSRQLLDGLGKLSAAGLLDKVELIHFHIGSQITRIRRIKNAVREAARVYSKVRRLGAPVRYLDVGGGLGVDYDGSRTSSDGSVNYGIQEYANNVVFGIQEVCRDEEVSCPAIISESGRMLATFHAMLVTDVRGSLSSTGRFAVCPEVGAHQVIRDLEETERGLSVKNYREYYHDALEYRDQMYSLFDHGILGLKDRADGESLFWNIAGRAMEYSRSARYMPEEFQVLESRLRDKYICNLSVFQSLPDSFALDQMFPVLPIHRLNERPEVQASLVDITCDSDGEVDAFVDRKEVKGALEVHELIPGRPYYLGFLLVGAYQEAMGSAHNLFGRVHESEAVMDRAGSLQVRLSARGQSALDTLGRVGHEESRLVASVRQRLKVRVEAGDLSRKQGERLAGEYADRLREYTYLV